MGGGVLSLVYILDNYEKKIQPKGGQAPLNTPLITCNATVLVCDLESRVAKIKQFTLHY